MGVRVSLRVMKRINIYNNNRKVTFSTLGMKTYNCFVIWGYFYRSLVVLYSSPVGYHYRFYSTNTSINIIRSTVEIVPVVTYLNPDTPKLAIFYENKNKAGYIDELIHLTKRLIYGHLLNYPQDLNLIFLYITWKRKL